MADNEFEGAARELGGKVQDAIGGVTGDAATQARGKFNQAAGQAQKTFGTAIDEIIANAKEKPLAAVAVVAGVSFLAGWLARK